MPGRLSLYVFVLGKGASRAVTLLKVMPGQLQASGSRGWGFRWSVTALHMLTAQIGQSDAGQQSRRRTQRDAWRKISGKRFLNTSRAEVRSCRADAKLRYPGPPAYFPSRRASTVSRVFSESPIFVPCDDVAHLSRIYFKILAMTEVHLPRLNWEASATATHPQVSSSLPSEVETCLKNARFVSGLPPLYIYISLTCDKAPSRNLRCHVPPHLPHELHLPALNALQPYSSDHYDYKSNIQKDTQSHQ